jgi:hypothetical protein
MGGFLHQVENEVRQNRIAIKISPVDSGIDKDTAAVDQGLVRHIQYQSEADAAVHAAFVEACRSGLGAFTLATRYVNDDTFDQELYIRQIPNAIGRCWLDPFAVEPERRDARYGFEVDVLSQAEFKRQFPDSETATSNFWDNGYGNFDHDWITDSAVRVANYWYTQTRKRRLLLLNTGQTVFEDDCPEPVDAKLIENDRLVMARSVHCAKLNGQEVLEEFEWPGLTIPIFLVLGEEVWVDGRRERYSLIHWAQDPQRLLNFYRSNEAEVISLAPKSPFIAAEGQIEGHEQQWKTANVVNYAVLPYNPVSVAGQVLGPPARNTYEPPIQALSAGAAQVIDEMKAATGIYDASLGARSNETSGVAIRQRQAEGDLANFHFIDNLARALTACGRAIVEVKPHYYDTPRMIQILGEDEKARVVRVNEQYVDENGVERHYKIADTKYNVTVATGPSYTSMRQEAWAQLTELARAYPALMQAAGHIIMRKSDIPGADEIADQLRRALPPELAADPEKDGAQQIPPQARAQLQAMAQQLEAVTTALNSANDDLKTRRLEVESRERIEALKIQARLIETEAKLGSQEAVELLRQEVAAISRRLDLLKADEPIEDEGVGEPSEPLPVAA